MAKKVWRTAFNHTTLGYPVQKKFGKSMTVPDQNMSVVEIMKRYASGRPIKGQSGVPIYDEETDQWYGVDPRSLDISERADKMREVAGLIEAANAKQAELDAAAKKKAFEDSIRQKIAKEAIPPKKEE